MSLINEALKRTRDGSLPGVIPDRTSAPNYQIPSSPRAVTRKSRTPVIVTICCLGVGLVAGMTYLVTQRPSTPVAVAEVAPPPQPETKSTATSAPPPVNEEPAAPVIEKPKEERAVPVAVPVAPALPPPKLVLQGITRDGQIREAMINGVNLREGDEIEGATVKSIEPRLVRLQFAGADIIVRIP